MEIRFHRISFQRIRMMVKVSIYQHIYFITRALQRTNELNLVLSNMFLSNLILPPLIVLAIKMITLLNFIFPILPKP